MTIHLDDPEERDALLEPQIESLKSVDERDAAAARRPLGRRLSIGGPVFRPVTPDDAGDDEQLHRFIESERGRFDYHLGQLTCTFRPEDGERFTQCWVGLELARADGFTDPEPIAWSMQPERLEEPIEVSTTIKLAATVKLPPIELSAGFERSTKAARRETYLQAYEEQESTPSWELYATPHAKLQGMQRLLLVVRAPAGVETEGKAEIQAKVAGRHGIIPYDATIDGEKVRRFTLAA